MSLVNLAHLCSHLQNASLARLGLTSVPLTNLHTSLLLSLQRSGFLSTLTVSGPVPPPPSALLPTNLPNPAPEYVEPVTQANRATRRLWIGLKYWNNEPVLRKMALVSKPTRRIWMGHHEMEGLGRGGDRGYVKGLRMVGECMYASTDKGVMEVRECVERKTGGMLLCRVY